MSAAPRVIVPLHNAPFCNHRNPKTGKPCRRAEKHAGRHAFIRQHVSHGLIRETWEQADCQVCGKATTDGAVCKECGS